MEDVEAIADLTKEVLAVGKKHMLGQGQRARRRQHAGAQAAHPLPVGAHGGGIVIHEQIRLLQRELRGQGIHFTWNDPKETLVEAFLTRGDRG
jgi:hypothetical protein